VPVIGGCIGDTPDAPVGPPGGNVGSLMVGAADGLGGRLMRTVSFLGCTLPVLFFIGSAPMGAPGTGGIGEMSAISLFPKDNRRRTAVKFNSETKLKQAERHYSAKLCFLLNQFAPRAA
jgi:hypothetical protein